MKWNPCHRKECSWAIECEHIVKIKLRRMKCSILKISSEKALISPCNRPLKANIWAFAYAGALFVNLIEKEGPRSGIWATSRGSCCLRLVVILSNEMGREPCDNGKFFPNEFPKHRKDFRKSFQMNFHFLEKNSQNPSKWISKTLKKNCHKSSK